MLREILEDTRKTRRYMQWQLYITIALVVIPFILIIVVLPGLLGSLGGAYGI